MVSGSSNGGLASCTAQHTVFLSALPRQLSERERPPDRSSPPPLAGTDLQHLLRAAAVSQQPIGQTQPHPYAGCVLVSAAGVPLAEASQWAQGTAPPERQVVLAAGSAARGATAYLNLETGDCHGDQAAVDALVEAGVARVVVGLRHPLPHLRGGAIAALRAAGVAVAVLGEAACAAPTEQQDAALDACLLANEALLHRAVTQRPLGLLKYAMTLDGKIATHTGHSAWVSSSQSRQQVFEMRARSDAVIVGGCTGGQGRKAGQRGQLGISLSGCLTEMSFSQPFSGSEAQPSPLRCPASTTLATNASTHPPTPCSPPRQPAPDDAARERAPADAHRHEPHAGPASRGKPVGCGACAHHRGDPAGGAPRLPAHAEGQGGGGAGV